MEDIACMQRVSKNRFVGKVATASVANVAWSIPKMDSFACTELQVLWWYNG